MGFMGKFALSVAGMLVLMAAGVSGEAMAKSVHSSAKKTKITAKTKKAIWVGPTRKKLSVRPNKVTPPEPVSEIEEGLSPFGSKFVSKRAHFAASQAPVPEEYNCDGAMEDRKKQEAEREALAKCEAAGEQNCRVHRSVILKTGELKCGDVPGRACKKEFIRGCVARAIAVGGEPLVESASVF